MRKNDGGLELGRGGEGKGGAVLGLFVCSRVMSMTHDTIAAVLRFISCGALIAFSNLSYPIVSFECGLSRRIAWRCTHRQNKILLQSSSTLSPLPQETLSFSDQAHACAAIHVTTTRLPRVRCAAGGPDKLAFSRIKRRLHRTRGCVVRPGVGP